MTVRILDDGAMRARKDTTGPSTPVSVSRQCSALRPFLFHPGPTPEPPVSPMSTDPQGLDAGRFDVMVEESLAREAGRLLSRLRIAEPA
jgi:hypothetical protein